MTSYIPLTTVFTPPASCSDNSYTLDEQDIYMKDINLESSECYPDGFKDLWSAGLPYSPGICPDNYYHATYKVAPWAGSGEVMEWLCCPTGMSVSGDDHSCHTTLSGQTVVAAPSPQGTFTISNPLVAVHGILIAFASSDASLIKTEDAAPSSSATLASSTTPTTQSDDPTATTSTGSTVVVTAFQTMTMTRSSSTITRTSPRTTSFTQGLASSSSSSSTTFAPPFDSGDEPASPGEIPPTLSSGTMAGIGVGATAAVVALAGLIGLTIMRRRRRRKQSKSYNNPLDVRVFDTAQEFNEDKKHWLLRFSPLSSPSSPQFSDTKSQPSPVVQTENHGLGIEEVQEADSRCVGREAAELE